MASNKRDIVDVLDEQFAGNGAIAPDGSRTFQYIGSPFGALIDQLTEWISNGKRDGHSALRVYVIGYPRTKIIKALELIQEEDPDDIKWFEVNSNISTKNGYNLILGWTNHRESWCPVGRQ